MQVVQLSHDFLEKILIIHNNCFENRWSYNDLLSMWNNLNLDGLIAIENSKPLGFILWTCNDNFCDIISMAVIKSHRKKGLATNMLKECINSIFTDSYCTYNIEKIFLEVNVNNNDALKVYKNLGFENIGLRKGYYSHKKIPEDALVMCISKKHQYL